MRKHLFPILIVAIVCVGLSAQAPTPPDTLGLSAPRLERLKSVMQEYADQGRLAGTITVVMRGGRVAALNAVGKQDVERNIPMRPDTIFRMASMSKAVTSVAAVMLMEEGKLRLADRVGTFLPAFKQTSVALPPSSPGGRFGVVAAKREITIRDLLTHTAGISYGGGPAAEQFKAAGLQTWYLADKSEPIGTLMERLAGMPFEAQPGEAFVYGYNTDILGAVIEKVSGMPLDQFFRTRIFEPLKMTDTCFYLPPEKRSRLATVYSATPEGGIKRAPEPGMGQGDYVDGPRRCFSGGAGLLSTANDYSRFLQMLLNGGELDGVRVLSPKFIEMMTSNHVGNLYSNGNFGFGLGFEIVEHVGRAGRPGSVGAYGWGSAYYSNFWVDPQEKLVAVFLTQLIPAGSLDLQDKFRYLVYQSIVGPPPAANAPAGARKGTN
ncbi:MAG: serine hydrolase domain-containing protein [Bacteroidales bacterium]